jgi:hypothetical protein
MSKKKKINISSLKKYCFELWSEIVKIRDGNKCFMCGQTEHLNSHHLITRKWLRTAFDTRIGICLCVGCHEFKITSVSHSPWILEAKLKKERLEQYLWYYKERDLIDQPQEKMTIEKYQNILNGLLCEYEILDPTIRMKSKYYKCTKYYEEKNKIKTRKSVNKTKADLKSPLHELCDICVCKIDNTGNVLKMYPSADIATINNGLTKNAIQNCIIGKRLTAGGYRWILQKDLDNPEKLAFALRRHVK